MHKLTSEEMNAKPEQPATDEQTAAQLLQQRRHTVAGTELDKPSAVPKNAGAKRKASTAATVAKKGKEVVEKKPIIKDEPLPSAQTRDTSVESPPQNPTEVPSRQVAPLKTPPPTPEEAHTQLPSSDEVPTSSGSPLTRESQQVPTQIHHVMNEESVKQQTLAALPPMSLSLPPLQLPPLQDPPTLMALPNQSPSWNTVSMPNSAPPTAVSTTRNTRSSEYSEEEDVRAMAQIAAELKRSAEGFPKTAEAKRDETEEGLDEDELLIKRIRQGGILEDVGDVSEFLNGTEQEADSTFVDEMMIDRTIVQLPPLSTSSSVGLPSLSSPGEQYLQQQQFQQYQQYQNQQTQMWSERYQQQQYGHQENGFVQEQHMHQQHQMHYEVPSQHQEMLPPMQQNQPNVPVQPTPQSIPLSHPPTQPQKFQEPQRPASQPIPTMRPGRRPSVPKTPAELTCSGCKKQLGSDYSLRRHRATCAELKKTKQAPDNPDYSRPPQRRSAKKAAILVEAEVIATNPKEVDPQLLAERKAAVAEAMFEKIEALPAPSVVHDVVNEVQKTLIEKK